MASFDKINYSLRPNKTIERALVFEAIRRLQIKLDLKDIVFIGFGSVWFTDFYIAHRALGIRDMISIEADEIGFARARFNAPFSTVEVRNEYSYNEIPKIVEDARYNSRPWLVWLDYDYGFDETVAEDVRLLVEGAPTNSIVLLTYDAREGLYGALEDRQRFLGTVFGDVVPDDMPELDLTDGFPETLASLTRDFLIAAASRSARPGGFVPAFQMTYRDSTPMVTVGGVLPAVGAGPAVREEVRRKAWPGIAHDRIQAPHLTIKEAIALQDRLPRQRMLTRNAVRKMGFDLLDEQIEAFVRYYRYYPTFAQVIV